jgi:ADP-L-glycero-D-manno-heptose 6-epimerase
MSKRFIITGGVGLIGCNIALALNEKGFDDLMIVDRLNHPEKALNLQSIKHTEYLDKDDFRTLMRNNQIEDAVTVFHMGACSSTTETDEEYLTDNNFLYTKEVCEWCLSHDARFIYASSAATYGDGSLGYSDGDDITPTLKPMNLYGSSKQAFDMWALENGVLDRIVGLKYFNVYGPHEDHKGDMRSMINKAYRQILDTEEMGLFKSYNPDYEDGCQLRDFVYVKDAVNATLFFSDNPQVSGLFNCGTGTTRSWLDLANAVFMAMEKDPKIRFIDMPDAIKDKYQYYTQADISKLRAAGYSNEFASLEDGIKDYVQNYLAERTSE